MKKSKAFSLIELSIVVLVVGILIAGAIQGSKMVYKARLTSAKNLTKSSGIESIKDMTLWLDATMANSNFSLINRSGSNDIQDNDPIKTWSDANPRNSGANTSFASPSSNRDPLYIENGLNGLPSLKFDGSNDYLEKNIAFGDFFKENEFTMFFVMIQNSTFGDGGSRFITCAGSPSRINLYINTTSPSFQFTGTTGSQILYAPTPSFSIDNVPILLSIRLKTDGAVNTKINGESQISLTISTKLGLGTTCDFDIGWNGSSTFNPQFYLSEMIFYNTGLKDEDRLYVEKYLSKKWRIDLR